MEQYTFSTEQLEQYFDRIALPIKERRFSVALLDGKSQFEYLTRLHKHQLVRVPFENLTQHYSWHRVIDVHPLHLHRKIVGQPGRGGYCLEANTLFHTALRSLGFHCYLVAGRVWVPHEGKWTGWSHVINIIVIDGSRYLCDVGFGPSAATQPMPVIHDTIQPQIKPAESRLIYHKLSQTVSDQKLWIYEKREDPSKEWSPAYCFSDTELLPDDLPGINYGPWIGRNSHFTQKVICVRFTVSNGEARHNDMMPTSGEIEAGEITGVMILNQDNFKWRVGGENVIDESLESEADRLEVIRRFGIELDIEDQRAILGTVSNLRGNST